MRISGCSCFVFNLGWFLPLLLTYRSSEGLAHHVLIGNPLSIIVAASDSGHTNTLVWYADHSKVTVLSTIALVSVDIVLGQVFLTSLPLSPPGTGR
jgi:hypothetical protein